MALLVLATGMTSARAQQAPVASVSVPTTVPPASLSSPTGAEKALDVTPTERQYFQLGLTLARASFAYADLAKQATLVSQNKNKLTQVHQLGMLAPIARRDREQARIGFTDALSLLQALHAPEAAQLPVTHAVTRLSKTAIMDSDAKMLAIFNKSAAETLAALNEFETLSSLPDSPILQHWLNSSSARSSQVWYAEGLIAALAEIASAQQMPDLLPPAPELATDLRGLRDWLDLRLPDDPTPDQITLKTDLDGFLKQASAIKNPQTLLTQAQMQMLGEISRRLQTQILPAPAPTATLPPPPPSTENRPLG